MEDMREIALELASEISNPQTLCCLIAAGLSARSDATTHHIAKSAVEIYKEIENRLRDGG